MNQTIFTKRLSLVATSEHKHVTHKMMENCKETVEYEIFLNNSSTTQKVGFIVIGTSNDNQYNLHYQIEKDFRRRGSAFETISGVLNAMPKGSTVFVTMLMVETPGVFEPLPLQKLLTKLGFCRSCLIYPSLETRYVKEL